MNCIKLVVIFIFITGILGCSSAKDDYSKLEKVLSINEKGFESAQDLEYKLDICKKSVDDINEYLEKYQSGEWPTIAKSALSSWQQRINEIEAMKAENIRTLPQRDYTKVEEILATSEQLYHNTQDYDTKIDICKNSIETLNSYLNKYQSGEWPTIAKSALSNWQQRLKETKRIKTSLINKLHALLKSKSEKAAKKRHPLSKIEECKLIESTEYKQEADLCITDIYAIRMRGNLIGRSIFKLSATVSGCINSSTNSVLSQEDVRLQE